MSIIQSVNSYITSLQKQGINRHFSLSERFEHMITDDFVPSSLNSKYRVVKMRGDGLCWVNSILGSIFGRFWRNPTILNKWFADINTTLTMFDESFKFCFGLPDMKIQYGSSSLVCFLNTNQKLLFALAHNIISFCVNNYRNRQINVNCPIFVDLDVCVSINAEFGFSAIDNNMRNFVMNVCGVEWVQVFQYKTDPNVQRSNDPRNKTTRLLENGSYAGFQVESFGTINVGGYLGSIQLYSYDSYHYDAFCLLNNSNMTAMISDIDERLERVEELFQREAERREAERREAERREAERREAERREAERRANLHRQFEANREEYISDYIDDSIPFEVIDALYRVILN